jgi:regulator of extracellular matrix RemA (YlzA/DUF370 family)
VNGFTPGPWRSEEEDGNFGIFSGDRLLAVVPPDDTPERQERRANAILMAAAPLLLQACRQLKDLLENNRVVTEERFIINDADARATLIDALMRAEGYRTDPSSQS